MSYRISPRADADMDEIWTYIAQDNLRAADRTEQALHDAMEQLARMPGLGQPGDLNAARRPAGRCMLVRYPPYGSRPRITHCFAVRGRCDR
jgi:plasmid stabilization system protein ParE